MLGFVVPSGDYRNQAERRLWKLSALAGVLLVLLSFYNVAATAIS
jgi:hypothetical protein